MAKYQKLFEPITIKSMTIRNRIGMAPMFTKYATEHGEPTDKLMEYLEARARGGVGLIVLENTAVDWDVGRADGNPVSIHHDNYLPMLDELVKRVHRHGAKIITELHHAGRQQFASNCDGPVAPSAIQSLVGGDMPREMTEEEIESTLQKFVDAARRTKDAGFDGVGIHGAHGYLISSFLSPRTNKRTDKWGGSFENRCRFATELVKRIRAEVGPDYPIFFRFSAEELAEDGLSLEEGVKYAKALEDAGVDCLDVSYGTYESVEHIAMQGEPTGKLLPQAKAVKAAVTIPVIGVGSLGLEPEVAEKALEDGIVDMVHFGRELLAEPNLVNFIANDQFEEARKCIRCSECLGCLDYRKYVYCAVNPECGYEYQLRWAAPPKLEGKRIVVVGAGPAGMEYAINVAKRGAKVTILEQEDHVGGLAAVCGLNPYKAPDINRMVDYYKTMLDKEGIDVRLNTKATVDTIKALHPDKVVLAMGSTPLELAVEGSDNALCGMDILKNGVDGLGENVLIIGGSGVGLDLAMFVNDAGKKTTVIEMRGDVGMELSPELQWHLKDMAEEKGITIHTNTKLEKLEKGVAHVNMDGKEETIPFDSAIYAVGFKRRDEHGLEKELRDAGIDAAVIGDMNGCGHFRDAIHNAYWLAADERVS